MARLRRGALMGELDASPAHDVEQPPTDTAATAPPGRRPNAPNPPANLDLEMFEGLLADIFSDARRAGHIIHGIHRLVRKGEENRREVDLNEVILEVLRLLHSDLLGRSTTVTTDLSPGLVPVLA